MHNGIVKESIRIKNIKRHSLFQQPGVIIESLYFTV